MATATRDALIGERLGLRQQERVRPARLVPDGGRVSAATRETLVSTGLHVGACRRLGAVYTNDEYLEAVEAAREAGDGTAYADRILGTDVDELIRGVEQDDGDAVVSAA